MSVTQQELDAFTRFAEQRLANGGAESMQQLLDQWHAQRDYEETVADVREGLADLDAGRVKPAEQAFSDIRGKLGWDT